MISRKDVENFFIVLIEGDFADDHNTAADVVGGLISFIPVLGQVMAARDITGTVFQINKQGGFRAATPEQLVTLAFAGFGAIPEVGSAFKTVFKPLWRERQLAKGLIHGGMEAVEALLHLGKGGAVKWVMEELIGKWGPRTAAAIAAVQTAIDGAVSLMEFISTAEGWEGWLIPDSIQKLAKELLPGLKSMRGSIEEPLKRGSEEIRLFLKDLLGEHAAAVLMAVGERVVPSSAIPGARSKTGHNAAAEHPQGHVLPTEPQHKVQTAQQADKHKGQGPVHSAMQITRKTFSDLVSREKGLIGEHMVDYHEAKRLGGDWPHDQSTGAWQPASVMKINCDKRPVNLSLIDLPKVNLPGIDAVWLHADQYIVTEAKASESIGAAYGFGKFKVGKGIIPDVKGLNPDLQLLHFLLSDSGDKSGVTAPTVQMSIEWVQDRAPREKISRLAIAKLENSECGRRVVLVTFESDGGLDHAQALTDINQGKTGSDVHAHPSHGITKEWEAAAIDQVVAAREAAHKAKNQPSTSPPAQASKPAGGSKKR